MVKSDAGTMQITFHGQPMRLVGLPLKAGDLNFARNWGILIQELGLLARAVYVIDRTNIVTYREIVSELTAAPNYEAAIAALKAIA
jgi:peroxiredoxin